MNMNTILLIAILLLLSSMYFKDAAAETGFYLEGGIAAHSNSIDCPEYCASNPLFDIGLGYTFKPADGLYIDGYGKHRSSGRDKEAGYGHNLLGARIRWYPGK